MLNRDYILTIVEKKLDSGDIQGAIKFIEPLIKDNPNDLEALNLLAIAHRLKGDFAEAMRVLKKALKIDPNYPETHYHIGLLYYEQGNYLKAIEEFYKAIENYLPRERSWMSDAYTALGEAFYKLGMVDDAIKSWKKAVEIYPKNRRAKYYLDKIEKGKVRKTKSPILVFDFLRFSDMKIDEYLRQKGKDKFDSEKEYKRVLGKIINAWNTKVAKISDKLKRMTDKEKLNYFKSIKIKF
ncbi:TPR repeat-containing protein [Candidatus Kryptobacter tengchongensis]|uniref:TPR repeat-containing protein n=1 Tax=Kryptobacter tengchongensis TaxID=1643429 RepID=A0A656D896_KRYT1|nr:tetratricopeptide repeat protein [Candidatus Kryptobacter tengchongensis]CUT01101.1 TPR repeat-containing protein [Candidatus Kryptobacter tengchongensis]CUU05046.1 TPR repeat-containing protein [Candidatus Kryptobacter tengchongensis]